MSDRLPYARPASAGLLGLLPAPAVDRWWERIDAWGAIQGSEEGW